MLTQRGKNGRIRPLDEFAAYIFNESMASALFTDPSFQGEYLDEDKDDEPFADDYVPLLEAAFPSSADQEIINRIEKRVRRFNSWYPPGYFKSQNDEAYNRVCYYVKSQSYTKDDFLRDTRYFYRLLNDALSYKSEINDGFTVVSKKNRTKRPNDLTSLVLAYLGGLDKVDILWDI